MSCTSRVLATVEIVTLYYVQDQPGLSTVLVIVKFLYKVKLKVTAIKKIKHSLNMFSGGIFKV